MSCSSPSSNQGHHQQQQQQQEQEATTVATSTRVTTSSSGTTSIVEDVEVKVGQTRIRDINNSQCVGSVAYHGPVSGHAGTYFGIVWDDPSRGKHDGSVLCKDDGKFHRYFSTPPGQPTSGSLVRPHLVDTGRVLTKQVLLERYKNTKGDATAVVEDAVVEDVVDDVDEDEQHVVSTVSGRTKPIQFVGRRKILRQQQWQNLSHMSLRCMGIRGISLNRVDEFCDVQHLTHLDVAGNLLSDWNVLPHLLRTFPNLTRLSLAKNRMVDETATLPLLNRNEEAEDAVDVFPNLTHLNLRDCHIERFATLAAIIIAPRQQFRMPNLQELCCAYSSIGNDLVEYNNNNNNDAIPFILFPHLKVLDATQCGLSSAEQLQALAQHCPNLESLSLNHNAALSSWPTTTTATCWPRLRELQLDGTNFERWQELRPIVQQHSLQLQSLRISCPLSLKSKRHALLFRMHWIAAVPTLLQYQSSTITNRKEMEQQYVLQHAVTVAQQQQQQQQQHQQKKEEEEEEEPILEGLLLPQDARYQDLMKTYAALVERKRATTGSTVENDDDALLLLSMVTVRIVSFCPSSCTVPALVRKLPLRLTLGRLKALIARHFGLDADLQHLQWTTKREQSFPIDLTNNNDTGDNDDNDEATLQDCGLVDGAEILVKEREIPKTAAQRQQDVQQAMLERVQQQEQERLDLDKRKAAAAANASSSGSSSIAARMAATTMTSATSGNSESAATQKGANGQ